VKTESAWFCGLDLGCVSDYTALACIERTSEIENGARQHRFAVRYLKRWLDVDYPTIGEELKPILEALRGSRSRPTLVCDKTGVGQAVVQLLARAHLPVARIVGVTITNGHAITSKGDNNYGVPKRLIASSLQAVLQTRRLTIASSMPEAETLRRELSTFVVKLNTETMHESFEHWRSAQHDDLVLACGLSAWYASHVGRRIVLGL
jgi:hypothetical protein